MFSQICGLNFLLLGVVSLCKYFCYWVLGQVLDCSGTSSATEK